MLFGKKTRMAGHSEWMTEEEWQFELALFDLLDADIIELAGYNEDGEPLIRPTKKFFRGFFNGMQWTDDD